MIVTLDFETASDVDLKECGAWVYAEHPTTEVLCLCATWYQGSYLKWFPGEGAWDLFNWVDDRSVLFEAHNAGFEQAIWHHHMVKLYGLPEIPIERWRDTMASCAYRGLPLALEKVADVLQLQSQKDMDGRKLTLSLSKPMTQVAWEAQRPQGVTQAQWKRQFVAGTYDRSPATLQRVGKYCLTDCATEAELSAIVGPLSTYEQPVWELDQRINQRGVRIDQDYVRKCLEIVDQASVTLTAEFKGLTGGIEPTQVAKIVEWCQDNGLAIESLAKPVLAALGIGEEAEDDDTVEAGGGREVSLRPGIRNLPPAIRRVLEIRSMLGSASIKKLQRMLDCCCADGRVRGLLQYHGAGTGRWAGRLFQPQNFPRGKIDGGHDTDQLVNAINTGDASYVEMLFGDPIAAVASGLRHAIIAGAGDNFHVGDFSGIEARIVLALAGQHDKTAMMAAGHDVYLDMACDIYNVPRGTITKADVEKRQIGKNTVLGCGFGMGWAKFQDRYCRDQPEEFARRVIEAYRETWAPKVPELWRGLEDAALAAVREGTQQQAYGVIYKTEGKWLGCHLPDGQIMWYYNPQLVKRPMPWDPTDIRDGWSYQAMKLGQWRTIHAYGGLLTENVAQKLARGLLCEAMFRLEANGFPVILTNHDEPVAERAGGDQQEFEQIMATAPAWARAMRIPIAVEGWSGGRYRK